MKKILLDIFNWSIIVLYFIFICLMIWHGFTLEIGNPEHGFHFIWTLYPLKRFFIK